MKTIILFKMMLVLSTLSSAKGPSDSQNFPNTGPKGDTVHLSHGRLGYTPSVENEVDNCFHEEGTEGLVCEKFLRPCRYEKSRDECKIRIVYQPSQIEMVNDEETAK